MKKLSIQRILIPTDFSETGLLALEHAGFMARLLKAELYLMHVIEVTESTFAVYNPAVKIRDINEIRSIVNYKLEELAAKTRKEYGVPVYTITSDGKIAREIADAAKDNQVDLIVMGTHGMSGFEELFIGSNAHKAVTIAPCPVITVQTHARKLGFTDIVLPIDNSDHSRQKVNYAIDLASYFTSKIHILGLLDSTDAGDIKKFNIKLDAVEEAVKKAGLPCIRRLFTGKSLAQKALDYSADVSADLVVTMTDHESHLNGTFMGPFGRQIVNHSKIPVLSIRAREGYYEPLALAAANPF